jgi:peptidoglycan-associated lipoprotein
LGVQEVPVFPILLLTALACGGHRNRVDNLVKDGVVDASVTTSGASSSAAEKAAVDALLANFGRVHFDTDSSRLGPDAQDALAANAAILVEHPGLRVEVEGHADERGTIDYNLALGQRRAAAVVDWLVARGVPPGRLRVTTYGEERPLDRRPVEVAWAENRRAEFRVVTGGGGVRGTVE